MLYSAPEFETLYKQLFLPAMRLALSLLHDEEEARDVVHEVFSKIWESNKRIENPSAFIIRAVRNASLNRISLLDTRTRVIRQLSLELHTEEVDAECNEEVLDAINSLLTTREQQIVDKIYQEGLSYKKTARMLDISESTVNKHVVSALKKLRCHFRRK